MMSKTSQTTIKGLIIISLFSLSSCRSSYQLATIEADRIEMTSAWDRPGSEAMQVLSPYKAKVDSIMTPVVGKSAMYMVARRPESLLSNLVADVLRQAAIPHLGKPADMALVNVGGLRNSLNQGDITYGNIFEILPFENKFCILTMQGKYIKELMSNILSARGEGVSNVQITGYANGEIESAQIGGEPIDEARIYTVATIDYLAEGNDKMFAFLKADKNEVFEDKTIRQVFLDYVIQQTTAGQEITSQMDGRIIIK